VLKLCAPLTLLSLGAFFFVIGWCLQMRRENPGGDLERTLSEGYGYGSLLNVGERMKDLWNYLALAIGGLLMTYLLWVSTGRIEW
jgi:hypothetical protein